ncbi:MAG TPA: SRPBCC family protein [Luteibacter sp.]|nr:SRPBCC family protein [Luteibacter sp.]
MKVLPPVECPDSHTIEASVTIRRPVGIVYAFYRDFNHLPSFLGDVTAIETIDPATTRWTIQAPLKMALRWTVRVTEEVENALIRYETVAHPRRRIRWDIHFTPGPGPNETTVREAMHAPLGALGLELLAWMGKPAAKEVAANLHRLKEVLETGRVSDRSYAVPGKFPSSDPTTI